MSDSLRDRYATTPLFGGNATYLEDLYERYLEDPQSVDPRWREYFAGARENTREIAHGPIRAGLLERARQPSNAARTIPTASGESAKQGAVSRLFQVYANRGHLIAKLD